MKPVHGALKPHNVPSDMVSTPPIPCEFAVGDEVTFTNSYGVKFDLVVRGFASKPHGLKGDRFIYVFTDAWWFPVEPSTLRHRVQEKAA